MGWEGRVKGVGVKETVKSGRGGASGKGRLGRGRRKEEKKKKDSRILETKSRVVGWSNNRAALNTVIPAMLG